MDAASLCFKSGNAVILRGGSEAFHSNTILVKIIGEVLKKNKIDPKVVAMVPFTDRSAMVDLLQLDKYIDVVIPRGGEGLMKFIGDHTRIPVIKHDKGVCSLFIDESASLEHAVKIVQNAKVQRPGVCNALENFVCASEDSQGNSCLSYMKCSKPMEWRCVAIRPVRRWSPL